ncbi:hypothetical protein V1512DRAFT_36627 [Lipomyces arxii]|uniref:uncharacterized protein n=1 Tax=Lipomyces arxii TaxID=56418 RepID=UPI0034D01263
MTAQLDTSDLSAIASSSATTTTTADATNRVPDSSLLSSALAATNSNLSRLTKTVVATSASLTGSNLYGDITNTAHYRSAINELAPTMRKPAMQRRLFSFRTGGARVSRSNASVIAASAPNMLLSKEMLADLPEGKYSYSLLQGFKATLPEHSAEETKQNNKLVRSAKSKSKSKELVVEVEPELTGIQRLERDKKDAIRKLQRLDVRKAIVVQGINELEARIEQLNVIKQRNMERLAKFEDQELELEDKLQVIDYRIELLQEDEAEADQEEQASEAPTNISGPADTESISVLALGESILQYSDSGSYHSDEEQENRQNFQYIQTIHDENDSEEDDETDEELTREMTNSMREAWLSSFLEWERLSGE